MGSVEKPPIIAEGKYEFLSKGEVGGMGEVYKVRHRLLGEVRALKIMRRKAATDPQLRERFLREARIVAQLRHPNLAQLFDLAFSDDGKAYMVLEWIEGLDVAKLLSRAGPPPVRDALSIATQALSCLEYLHDRQLVHRDISADNLMITTRREGGFRVKVIDLGIAKSVDDEDGLTRQGSFVGKLRYAAPEVVDSKNRSSKPDPRSDLYSFGVVLYELLTGVSPIRGNSEPELVAGHLLLPPLTFEETDPQERVPTALRQAVLRALRKDPADRFQTAREFSQAISQAGSGLSPVVGGMTRLSQSAALPDLPDAPVANDDELSSVPRELDRTIDLEIEESSLASRTVGSGNKEEDWFLALRREHQRRETRASTIASSVIKVVREHPKTMLSATLGALLLTVLGFSGVLAGPSEEPDRGERPPDGTMTGAARNGREETTTASAVVESSAPPPTAGDPAPAPSVAAAPATEGPNAEGPPSIALISNSPELTSEVLRLLGSDFSIEVSEHLAAAMAGSDSGRRPRLAVQLDARLGQFSTEAYDTAIPACEAATSGQILTVPGARSLYSRTFRRTAPRCGEATALAGRQLAEELVAEIRSLL